MQSTRQGGLEFWSLGFLPDAAKKVRKEQVPAERRKRSLSERVSFRPDCDEALAAEIVRQGFKVLKLEEVDLGALDKNDWRKALCFARGQV